MSFIISFFLLLSQPNQKRDYSILFTKIDNQAIVYVNDSLVYNSGTIDGNPDLDIKIALSNYLKKGPNDVKVELYNGSGDGFFEYDEHWEILYEVFENNDPIDYLSKKEDNGKAGLVLSTIHEIYVD